jgi:small subunit ribosomal protein S16
MVQVMIRLQNHGKKNHPYWWIIVQPKNKCFKGRALERIGIWAPRKTKTVDRAISINTYKLKYWLSVGATPTNGAQRLLSMAGHYVKKPVPYGSKFLYEKKGKTYPLDYFHKHRWGLQSSQKADILHYERIKRMEDILKRKIDAETEALSEIIRPRDLTSKYNEKLIESYNTEMNTDDINSDDFDFYSRKRNFDLISKKMNKYLDTKFQLYRGNDLRYNNYLRKLEKLSKHENLDYEGFKDYLKGIKELSQSKDVALQNIASHFLTELIDKESLQNEIREILNSIKLNEKENEKSDGEDATPEIKKEILKKSAERDLNSVIDVLTKGFENVARQTFKVGSEENFTDKAFQDLKNLRMAKLLIKLRCGIIQSEQALKKFSDKLQDGSFDNKPKSLIPNSSSADFFASIHDNLNSSTDDDSPLFDKEILKLILSKHENITSYDDMLFDKINNYLLSTETFQKFSPVLFDPEFYGYENITSEERSKILKNPNVYLLNNEIIDELISSLLVKINKKYEMNEIYRDEEKDLKKFEAEEIERVKRRNEMEKKIEDLKNKHGNFDMMYDDYKSESKDLRDDLSKFKQDYQEELEAEFDDKFKRTLKMIRPPLRLRKYYTQEEIEETTAKEEKFERIKNRVYEEIKLKRIGIIQDPKDKKETEELTPEEKGYEEYVRFELETKILGSTAEFDRSVIPLPDDDRPQIDLNKYLEMTKRKYKKQGKLPRQEEILKFNKIKLRLNEIYVHSLQASRGIPKERQEQMKKRFLHYFGRYKNMIYPDGFRHYENFETYQTVFPERAMIEYQRECKIYIFNFI